MLDSEREAACSAEATNDVVDEWNSYEWEMSSGSKVAGTTGEENSKNEDIQDTIQESLQELNSLEDREENEDEIQIMDVVDLM